MCWWAREEKGVPYKTGGVGLALVALMSTPFILGAAVNCYRSTKNGCHQDAEGTCCRVEKKGDAAEVYFDGERGRYQVRQKTDGNRLEYCYTPVR